MYQQTAPARPSSPVKAPLPKGGWIAQLTGGYREGGSRRLTDEVILRLPL